MVAKWCDVDQGSVWRAMTSTQRWNCAGRHLPCARLYRASDRCSSRTRKRHHHRANLGVPTGQDTLRSMLRDLTEEAGIDCWICPAIGTVAPVGNENTGDS